MQWTPSWSRRVGNMSSCLFWDGFGANATCTSVLSVLSGALFGGQTQTKVIRWCYAAGYVDSVQVGTRWPG